MKKIILCFIFAICCLFSLYCTASEVVCYVYLSFHGSKVSCGQSTLEEQKTAQGVFRITGCPISIPFSPEPSQADCYWVEVSKCIKTPGMNYNPHDGSEKGYHRMSCFYKWGAEKICDADGNEHFRPKKEYYEIPQNVPCKTHGE